MPDISLALLAIVPLAVVELAKTARWRTLFGARRPSYAVCLRALVAGQLTNALSPLRAGEAVRLGILSAQGGPVVTGAGALAGVKAIDTLCLGALAFAVAGASVFTGPSLGLVAGVMVVLAGVAVAIWGSALRDRLEANPITRKLRLAALIDVAQTLKDPQALAIVLGTTALVWTAGIAANLVLLPVAGSGPNLHLAAQVIVAGYIAALLPTALAQFGAIAGTLMLAGIPTQEALAFSGLLQVCQLVKLGLLLAVSLVLTVPPARWPAWARWAAPGA